MMFVDCDTFLPMRNELLYIKVDVDHCLPHDNYCCLLRIRFLKSLLKSCRFVKVDDDVMGDIIEESKLLNYLMSLKVIQLPHHVGIIIWIFIG